MQKSNLSTVRALLVGGKGHAAANLRTVLNAAGVTRVTMVAEPQRALELLCMEPFDAMFVQDHVMMDDVPFAIAARRHKGLRNPLLPIVAVFSRARQSDVESARDLGVNDVICRPMAPKTVMDKLQAALMAPRPFIAAPDFFGPDRRATARAAMGFPGSERRKRTPRKARIGRAEAEYLL